ncbi:MAG: hypothetical protein HUK20_09935 [Fibrobacter sp.]|nr:hypothetical protein [Fibrobacter sp.]
MKYLGILFGVLVLAACSSTSYMGLMPEEKVEPLPANAKVGFLYALEVPMVPESAIYLGTIQTNVNVQCTALEATRFLEGEARRQGSNLVFVKNVREQIVVTYVGQTTVSHTCTTILADFYAER